MRAFLALDLPPHVKDYLETVIAGMAPLVRGVRWVKRDGLHITLKFLGEIGEDLARQMKDALPMIRTGYQPFRASIRGVDAFPTRRRARVVIVTLGEGVETIQRIFDDTEKGLSRLAIGAEERRYVPHITLGRAKVPAPLSDKDIVPLEEKSFMLDRMVLFQSTLTREGALYTPVWDIKFGG